MSIWIEKAVGIMHVNKITQIQLAKKMGVTNDYISMILRGVKSPQDAESRIMAAINEIIKERKSK